jgi:8-oxo-dGTP diphosphatase
MTDPASRRTEVVGAALVRDGRVLAARRTRPAAAAGRWEFPGGKVEGAETPEEALVREIREELGCAVEVERWLAGSALIGTSHRLTVAVVRVVGGEPVPHEHDAVRWLGPEELDDVDWLEPDRPFLGELAGVLRGAEVPGAEPDRR